MCFWEGSLRKDLSDEERKKDRDHKDRKEKGGKKKAHQRKSRFKNEA